MVVKRGSSTVCLAVIKNPGARFSDAAYAILIDRGEQDGEITKALALRPGTPDVIVRKLLTPSSRQTPAAKPNDPTRRRVPHRVPSPLRSA